MQDLGVPTLRDEEKAINPQPMLKGTRLQALSRRLMLERTPSWVSPHQSSEPPVQVLVPPLGAAPLLF
jgi:hypothetical protein